MGRKVHPTGFRIGVIRDWQAKWYGGKHYLQYLQEDLKLRQALRFKYADASISLVETDRQANKVLVNIYTSRPGVVIGRGGQRVDEIRQYLESLIGGRVQLNIMEVRQPELDAYLVARSVAEQIERRIAFRRAMKRAIFRTLEAGAKGVRISCSGRLGGTEIARREMRHQGQVPLHKLRADIDYGFTEAHTTLGRIGVKVWIYRGDILPQAAAKVEEAPAEAEAEEAAASLAEKVAEPVAEERIEAEPSPPAELVTEVAEAAPVEIEEKPKKPAKRAKKAEAAEAAPVEAEEKPKKPAKRAKKAEAAEAAPVEAEEKPKKPAKKAKKAEAAEAAPVEAEEKPKKPAKRAKKKKKKKNVTT